MRTTIQGVSTRCVAIAAEMQKIGDFRIWNGGSRSQLIELRPKGKTMLVAVYSNGTEGNRDERTLKRTTPVVMVKDAKCCTFLNENDRNVPQI